MSHIIRLEQDVPEGRYEVVHLDGETHLVPVIGGSAPLQQHGAHLVKLDLAALAAGSAVDTSNTWTYHRFAADLGVVDATGVYVLDASITADTAITGAATNNFGVDVRHFNNANSLKDRLLYTFASGVNATAFTPISIYGAATGGLTIPTGTQLPWLLAPGDSISFKRTSSNATGLLSPGLTVMLLVGNQS